MTIIFILATSAGLSLTMAAYIACRQSFTPYN